MPPHVVGNAVEGEAFCQEEPLQRPRVKAEQLGDLGYTQRIRTGVVVEYVEDELSDRCCAGDEVRLEVLVGDGAQHLVAATHRYRHQMAGYSEHRLRLIEANLGLEVLRVC